MCGRYTLLAGEDDIMHEFGLEKTIQDYQVSYNVAPGQNVLAIIQDGEERRAGYLKWGLVPSWAQDAKIGSKLINARSETSHQKPSFRKPMAQKRCLIVADSFYEWQKTDNGKQPKRIHPDARSLFAFAGLWDKWTSEGKNLFTCTILTTDANASMQPIHDRMPVILPKEYETTWLDPDRQDAAGMQAMLESLEMEPVHAYNVSTRVNSFKNNDAGCIESIT